MPAPYSTIEDVLNSCRVRVNDAIASLAGDVLTDNADFTIVFVNDGWRKFQSRLLANGYRGFSRLKEETILSNVPAIGNSATDWSQQLQLSWTSTPALPQDLIAPIDLWERPHGYQFGFLLMDRTRDGLPTAPKMARNIVWDWRNDTLCLPGTTVSFDLRARYFSYLADFTDIVANPAQPVPILRCLNPFADFIAAEFCSSREDLDAGSFLQSGEAGVLEMIANEVIPPSQPAQVAAQ